GLDTRRLGAGQRRQPSPDQGFPLLPGPGLRASGELPDRGGLHDAGLPRAVARPVPAPTAVPDGRLRRAGGRPGAPDIRRFGAGRESGFIYHRARASLIPLLILLPSAALLGVVVCIAATTFKKYL